MDKNVRRSNRRARQWTGLNPGGTSRPAQRLRESWLVRFQPLTTARGLAFFADMTPLVERAAATAHHSPSSLLLSVTVDVDKSVFVQMALFALLMFVLKPLLFQPMLDLFAVREGKTDGAKSEARDMQERAADILARYETELAVARTSANAERETLRRETAKMEAEVLAEAQKSADGITREGRARVAQELETLRSSLATSEAGLARQISAKVLGREVRP